MGLHRKHILGINEGHRRPQMLDMAAGSQSLSGPGWSQNLCFQRTYHPEGAGGRGQRPQLAPEARGGRGRRPL